MTVLEEVAKTSIQLLLEEPFFSHLLASLNKQVVSGDHKVKTMCLKIHKQQHVVVINEAFWREIIPQEELRYGLLKHEMLHIVLMHTVADTREKNKLLCYIAMDLVVNQFIDTEQLPEYSLTLNSFPQLMLARNQTWEYYYRELLSLTEEELSELLGDEGSYEGHELWDEESSVADLALQLALVNQLIGNAREKTSAKSWDNMDGFLKEYLDSLFIRKPPQINWRKMLRLFANSSQRTRIKNSSKRVSKRYGTVPGIKVERTTKLLIAIDTSGSVEKHELEEFFTEVHHLWRTGVEILLAECDSLITRTYFYTGTLPEFVTGRGGTDFNAPLRKAKEEIRPDGVIYFTDGFAPAPSVSIKIPVLWVLSSNGLAVEDAHLAPFPGRKIKIEK